MKKCRWQLGVIASCWIGIAGQADAALLVHYTFDEIVSSSVVDSAGGDNNAEIVNNVSIGVPGVLGDAIRLPNDDGVSYVHLPASLNPAPNGDAPRTIAFLFSQELVGSENKMFGYGTANPGRSFDVSLEGGGIRLRYSGGNVTWGSGYDFAGGDAGFHHLAIRVPNGAIDYLDIEVLVDGNPLAGVATGGSPGSTIINTGGGVATNLDIGRSPAFAPSGDFIGLIDDFRIYDIALTDQQIRELIPPVRTLVLEVDPLNGVGAIHNRTDELIELDYYEVTGSPSAINGLGWNSLETQNRLNFPSGDGLGNGWEELGTADEEFLAEGRLQGLSSLEPGAWINLGNIFSPAAPQDLTFTYGVEGVFHTIPVQFVVAGPTADFDHDGDVDANDLARWHTSYGADGGADTDGDGSTSGADFLAWQRQFAGSLAPASATGAVPEPKTLGLLCLVTGFLTQLRWPRLPSARDPLCCSGPSGRTFLSVPPSALVTPRLFWSLSAPHRSA